MIRTGGADVPETCGMCFPRIRDDGNFKFGKVETMSFGGGLGAGIGAGIAIGVGAARKETGEKLKKYMLENRLTVHDQYGQEMEIDLVLQNALSCSGNAKSQKVLVVLLIAGLAAFLIAGLAWMTIRGG